MNENNVNKFPGPSEYDAFYSGYISGVQDPEVLSVLRLQQAALLDLLGDLSDEQACYRYAPGKWSLKEVVGHLVDCERVFVYRALCFARGDAQPLPGFEQDDFVRGANFDARTLASLAEECDLVRRSSLALFESLEDAAWSRPGHASGADLTVRAVPWILAGHEIHHMGVIAGRYLAS